jgi:Asp-tRNA(Asn)/Glu-tRNA(Gln) amidotransferase C subunit
MDASEIEEIKREAKKILDKFSKALENAKIKEEESNVEREEDRRKEKEGKNPDENKDFREIMFENAPNKNEDFVIAEKKSW